MYTKCYEEVIYVSIETDILEYKRKKAREASRKWYQKNKKRKYEYTVAYQKANPDKCKEYNRRSYWRKKTKC